VAEAAAKLDAPRTSSSRTRRTGRSRQAAQRLDTPDKVTGKQVYGADLKLPGMLIAAIKESPVMGGKLKSFDAAKVEKMRA